MCQGVFPEQISKTPKSRSIFSDGGGAVAVIFGLTATVLVAILGLGVDLGYWYRTDRELQDAADAAAIAAARLLGATAFV